MKDFNYYAPTEIVLGEHSEEQVAQLTKRYGGMKVLVHYGGGSVIDSGKAIAMGVANPDVKVGYSNDILRPKFAIMNLRRTFTLPPYQTQSVGKKRHLI